MTIEAAPTVRDSLVAAMETVEAPADTETVAAPPPVETPAETLPPAGETEAQKAERLRDEKGRFVEGKVVTPKEAAKLVAAPAAAAPPVVEAPKIKVPRPTSWKKELESHWDTLPPEIQSYVNQREREYATGVSTYKSEADRAKDVMSAIAPFEPHLQKFGVPVNKWINDLGTAHHNLALGSQQDKVQQVVRIIQGYGVDAQALFDLMSGKQPQYKAEAQRQAPQQQSLTQQDIEKVVEQKLLNDRAAAEYKAFSEAKDEAGQSKYPHFEEVKGTMAGLLQADLAQDYPSAYEAALRHPRHANIFEAVQQQHAALKEAERVKVAQAAATRARSQAVSVKSSTPTTLAPQAGQKGLREQLAESFDAVTASRV